MRNGALARRRHECELRGVDLRMRPWIVAEPAEEHDRPHQAEQSEHLEGAPPRYKVEDIGHEQRRERATPPRRKPQARLRPLALPLRQPQREDACEIRKAPGFAHGRRLRLGGR